MREIKFRKWHKELSDMTFWDGSKERNQLFWHTLVEYPNMYQLMQFTGLKDKNGKEIYSKDVIKQGDSIYRVEMCIGGFECIVLKELKSGGYIEGSTYDFSVLSEKHCEVIGNIYEPKIKIA